MSESSQETNQSIFQRLFSKIKLENEDNQIDSVSVDKDDTTKNKDETDSVVKIEKEKNSEEEKNAYENFKTFCKEIKKFMDYIENNENFHYYVYQHPYIIQKHIDVDVKELQILLAEIRDTSVNLQKLKNQRKLVKKETSAVKKTIQRVRDNEIRELESILSYSDKDLYTKWTKSKWKYEALEELLFETQEKQMALECLVKLINKHMSRAKDNALTEKESSDSAKNNKLVPFSSSLFSFQSEIPSPPAIPRPIPLTVNAFNRNSKLSWVQRRFRAERRGNYAAVRPSNEADNEPYPFPSFTSSVSTSDSVSSRFSWESTRTSSSSRQTDDDALEIDV